MKTIKTFFSTVTILTALALLSLPVKAATYLGTGNAIGSAPADGAGISSVVINNTATTISFTINSSQAMASYIFYAIQIQHIGQAGSGDTSLLNPWGPAIGISTGQNAVINTYGTGGTPGIFSSGSWVMGSGANYDAGGTGSTFATMTFGLSDLGLSVGDSFYFDAVATYTSFQNSYPQSAYGALDSIGGYPAETDSLYQPWNPNGHQSYYDSATDASGTTFGTASSLYTVTAVPEPTALALLGLGGLLLGQRLRRGV